MDKTELVPIYQAQGKSPLPPLRSHLFQFYNYQSLHVDTFYCLLFDRHYSIVAEPLEGYSTLSNHSTSIVQPETLDLSNSTQAVIPVIYVFPCSNDIVVHYEHNYNLMNPNLKFCCDFLPGNMYNPATISKER